MDSLSAVSFIMGDFKSNYNAYQTGTDPRELLDLRPKVIKYAHETARYNAFMKNIRTIGFSIWVVNMIHAYLVTREMIF